MRASVLAHLQDLYDFYGMEKGVRIARKHIQWYTHDLCGGRHFWREISEVDSAEQQLVLATQFFDQLAERNTRLADSKSEGEALTA